MLSQKRLAFIPREHSRRGPESAHAAGAQSTGHLQASLRIQPVQEAVNEARVKCVAAAGWVDEGHGKHAHLEANVALHKYRSLGAQRHYGGVHAAIPKKLCLAVGIVQAAEK